MFHRLTILAPALGCLALGCADDVQDDLPNVVLIVLDTTRADLLSAYGYEAATTPHLESIALEGTRFTRAFSTDFWTVPSHASILTGLYPSDHGATSETNRLSDDVATLAERLAEAGYQTAAFVSNPWLSESAGFARGFARFEEVWRARTRPGGNDPAVASQASSYIRERSAAQTPFFVFVNLNFAHMPYSPQPLDLVAVVSRPHPVERTRELKKLVGGWEHLAGAVPLDSEDFAILRDLYLGDLRTVDGFVAEIDEAIQDAGIRDRTLVIVTSDHGENLGEHGLIDHVLSMYETTIRVPLVMRFPGRLPAAAEVEDLVSLIDLAPTVLDAAGLSTEGLEGRSLLSGAPAPDFVVAENERPINGIELLQKGFPEFDTSRIDGPMRMLRTERYKLIESDRGSELYDLDRDPGEEQDLSESRPELVEKLRGQLAAWNRNRTGRARDGGGTPPIDPEAQEQLRALGYVE